MAKWEDLPPEPRHRILKALCTDIITEFDSLKSSIKYTRPADGKTKPRHHRPSQWHPPSCLKSFHSALLTNHDFFNTISAIQIDDRTPREILMEQQFKMVEAIPAYLKERHYDEHHDLPTMRWWTSYAGYFWKNPLVLAHPKMLAWPLRWNELDSGRFFIPQMEAWLERHAAENVELADATGMITVMDGDGKEYPDFIEFVVHGSSRGLYVAEQFAHPGSRLERDRGRREGEELILGERDINSSPDWWCFYRLSDEMDAWARHWDGDDRLWAFVNFKEKRMYWGPVLRYGYSWEDPWNERTWRVYKPSLDELDKVPEEK
jgi:hypothetical protein